LARTRRRSGGTCSSYTRSFGGDRVTRSDVLHVAERNPGVTIVADLARADNIASDTFDCIILTQTLQFVQDVPAVLNTTYRILRPGGVVLATFPGISQISRYDMDRWGHYWSFTTRSAKALFEAVFPAGEVSVEAKGNVLTASAFLYGLAAEELAADELESCDPEYEVLITVVARKAATAE
jgi:SAM-dependent methyltransferase